MRLLAPSRHLAILLIGIGAAAPARAQSGQPALPPISPTALASSAAVAMPAATQPPPQTRAQVIYTLGRLEIFADNSSLNQILAEVSHLSGMTISGGVAEQRVFGKYGPAAPAEVLATLLDGTGANMLLLADSHGAPVKLILTRREGGPTPPDPNAAALEAAAEAEHQRQMQQPSPPRPILPQSDPRLGYMHQPAYPGQVLPTNPNLPTAPNSPGPNVPTSPNGVLTPQQIYQQLQTLQNAQPQQH